MPERQLVFSVVIFLAAFLAAGSCLVSCHEYDDDDECDFDDDDFWDDDDDFDDDDDCIIIVRRAANLGEVVVLVTDNPDARARSFLVTVHSVVLEGRDVDPQILYDSAEGHQVDLLALRERDGERRFELLVSPTGIPPSIYDRLRLTVADPVLVLASGEVVLGEEIELAGAGEIEVALERSMPIGPGECVHLEIDFDLEHSLARAGGAADPPRRWRFRPLTLIDAVREESRLEFQTITSLSGTVSEFSADRSSVTLELPDGRGAIRLAVDERTVTLDARGAKRSHAAIPPGAALVVEGALEAGDEIAARRIRFGPRGEPLLLEPSSRVDDPALSSGAAAFDVPWSFPQGFRLRDDASLRGVVLEVDPPSRTVAIAPEEAGGTLVVEIPAGVPLVHVTEDDLGLVEERITLGDVRPGMLLESLRPAGGDAIRLAVLSGTPAPDHR